MNPARRSPNSVSRRSLLSSLLGSAAAFGCLLSVSLPSISLLGGCQRPAKVDLPVASVFEGERTYAWTDDVPAAVRVGSPAGQEKIAAVLRKELDGSLAKSGFEKVSAQSARFHASLYLGVEQDTRTADPLFTVYPAERIERGHAVLTLIERSGAGGDSGGEAAAAPAWTGSTSAVLRVTERGMGQGELRWRATEDPRSWPVGSIVSALGKRLP